DAEALMQLLRCVALAQVLLEPGPAMLAQTVAAIEVVDHEAVHAAFDTAFGPPLEDAAPVWIGETGVILLHAADAVVIADARRAVGVLLQQVERVLDRFRTQLLFVPQVTVELEEAARPLLAVGIADQEADVDMADDLDLALVQLCVEVLEPLAAL